ncbi:hypothetical protein [Salinarimonas soli]|uniref:UrcA family protein n=1 Tax=Salinarimonas soli TaxID=1638099 RepID=A0A5B2VAL5_9HYPH|nr:hypothetical protein [Salinarimonas soli]KAA2235645.1 hypothetical protein F0L46_19325 [Salinarimonas soli]
MNRSTRTARQRLAPSAILCAWCIVQVSTAGSALAGCAEDLTRIQLALPHAEPQTRSHVSPLVTQAAARAKAVDAAGCETLTRQALEALHLPTLAAVQLSTPVTEPPAQGSGRAR